MSVVIATSFTKSLGRLTGNEQAAAKVSAFDIQQNPESPGLSLHRIDRCRDPGIWSARVNRDIRIVLHKRGSDTALLYVGHHDDAYDWAERHRLDVNSTTGATQIVEIRETVEEIVVRRYVEEAARKPPVLMGIGDDTLRSWGVPEDWLETVLQATDDTVLDIALHLPAEAAEAVVAAAAGEQPVTRLSATTDETGFNHPDARRRFTIIGDEAELAAALDAPWDDWAIFLHPAQREFVDRNFNGPARVIGSAGTGKTVVALHRAVRLAADDSSHRVLLTTFNNGLIEGLRAKLARLTANRLELADRITVATLPEIARRLAQETFGDISIATADEVDALVADAASAESTQLDFGFLREEWRLVVDAWNVVDASVYRDLPRLGRKVRMAASRRDEVWHVFELVRSALERQGKQTESGMIYRVTREMRTVPFTHIVVDEAQDISVPELHLAAAIVGARPNGLFFAGDIGQRIFRSPFPWKAAGVDIAGRSRSLKVNYRTSHQIRAKSDLLLPQRLLDADGGEENRLGVSSIFHGPPPQIEVFDSRDEEVSAVAAWIRERIAGSFAPQTIAILVRSERELPTANLVKERSGADGVQVGLMYDAKGQEFRAVAVIACDEDVIPSENRLMSAVDERALKEIYDTERHLLYVAATRARERLWLSCSGTPSEFLVDVA